MAIAAALGGVLGAVGSIAGGAAQSDMYSYQAGIARQNEQIAKQNAGYALISGESAAAQSGMQSRFRAGEIKAAQGASGFQVNSGTNVDVREGQQLVANTEQTNIRANAAKTSYDYTVSGVQEENQARVYDAAADNATTAGFLGVVSSIVGGAGSVASKWLQGTQYGMSTGNILFGNNGLGF